LVEHAEITDEEGTPVDRASLIRHSQATYIGGELEPVVDGAGEATTVDDEQAAEAGEAE
jgi:hypothetical protein